MRQIGVEKFSAHFMRREGGRGGGDTERAGGREEGGGSAVGGAGESRGAGRRGGVSGKDHLNCQEDSRRKSIYIQYTERKQERKKGV